MADRIGFTGTRVGMSPQQVRSLATILTVFYVPNQSILNNGLAKGADAMSLNIAYELGYQIFGYPSNLSGHDTLHRLLVPKCHYVAKPMNPLDRNKVIVDNSDRMIACPKDIDEEEVRSGTWHCVRYAMSVRKPVILVGTDGAVRVENNR
jgi:hypothetical protein